VLEIREDLVRGFIKALEGGSGDCIAAARGAIEAVGTDGLSCASRRSCLLSA
jgi:hypothetical protein